MVFVAVEPRVQEHADRWREHAFGSGLAVCCYLSDGKVVDRCVNRFARPEHWWYWLEGISIRKGLTWVYSYNALYTLTLLGFWRKLDGDRNALMGAVLDDPPVILVTRHGRQVCKYVDVRNYWQAPLSDLNPVRPAVPQGDAERDKPGCSGVLSLESRVSMIEELICSLICRIRDARLCSWQATAAGLAWSGYLTSFLSTPIMIHGQTSVLALERAAYFGGRLELLSPGHVRYPVTAMDANSLYPSVMTSQPYPAKLLTCRDHMEKGELRDHLHGHVAVACCDLYSDHPVYPVRVRGAVHYSQAPGTYVLTGPELGAALSTGSVRRVGRVAVYDVGDLFTGWVSHWYPKKVAAKAEGRQADLILCKMMLNSLYGKFAQQGRRWVHDTKAFAPDKYAWWWQSDCSNEGPRRYRSLGGFVQRLQLGGESRNSFPLIAALVTSRGRACLNQTVEAAGPNELLYCDTDSVHVLGLGRDRMHSLGCVDPTRLGAFREHCSGEDAHYYSPKNYRIGNHWCLGAVCAHARQVSDGVWLSETRHGAERILTSGSIDTVTIRDRLVHVERSLPADRPRPLENYPIGYR